MPVFTIEIDTDAKTCKKSVNGIEADFDTMSLAQYSYLDDNEVPIYEYNVNIGKRYGNEKVSQFFTWTEKNGSEGELEHSKEVYAEKSFKPTSGMKSEAKKGLDWRKEHGRGGTEVGIARARDIANDKNLSYSTVKRMKSFFARHESNKSAEGFSPGEKGYPSNGRIAWALWGGDSGKSWAEKIVKQQEKKD